jgi:uncharacterized protein (UPF0332 family)
VSLPHDLLRQAARALARLEPKKPKQASLRRAVSAAYYSLFHLLTDEASRLLVSGSARHELRQTLRRAFDHGEMKGAARAFVGGTILRPLLPVLKGRIVQPELKRVAQAFVELQDQRHEADYDHMVAFNREETLGVVSQAERAFRDWKHVRGSVQADVFLTALLVQKRLRS